MGDQTANGTRGISVNGHVLQGYLTLAEAGLHDGAIIHSGRGSPSRETMLAKAARPSLWLPVLTLANASD